MSAAIGSNLSASLDDMMTEGPDFLVLLAINTEVGLFLDELDSKRDTLRCMLLGMMFSMLTAP